jgi:hypothetical protein
MLALSLPCSESADLFLKLPLGALEVLDQQVLACELLVVAKVVDALPIMQMNLIQFVVNPAARRACGQHAPVW